MTSIEEIIELFRELEKVLDECGNNYSDAELQLINQESAFNKLKLIAYKYWFSDKKELAKYKRAFEILKREKNVTLEKMSFDDYYLYYIIYYGTYSDEITKEEYELLEELMEDE